MSTYGILAGILLAILAGTGAWAYEMGHRSAQEACASQAATTLAASLQEWQQRAQSQSLADAAAKSADQERQKAASDQLESIANKFAGIKLQVAKVQPQARCELSQDYVRLWNGEGP
jgi:hypothetical protein